MRTDRGGVRQKVAHPPDKVAPYWWYHIARAPSQWGTLYSRMTPKEFRETFRIPRELFDEIVTTLRPVLQTEYVGLV